VCAESAAGLKDTLPRWDLADPHVIALTVADTAIDAYNHVNNAVYLRWCDEAAWSHSAALGVPLDLCLQLDRGMAVHRSVIRYEKPALLGDAVSVATWIVAADGRLRATRRFQIVRPADDATLARAEIEYVCLQLSTGRPTRFPAAFVGRYASLPDLSAAIASLAPL
jgi:acyl-CoA thioester hydrolase